LAFLFIEKMQKRVKYYAFVFLLAFTACKKDDDISDPYGYIPPTDDRTELTLDSIYMYANEIWLWNTALPGYDAFSPRKYTTESDLASYRNCLFNLLQYARRDNGTPYEQPVGSNRLKYSYMEVSGSGSSDQLAAVSLEGIGDDYGFEVGQYVSGDVRLLYVNPGSVAHHAGFKRGDRILRINGVEITTTGVVRTLIGQSEINLEAISPDGMTKTASLRKGPYSSNGVLKNKVIESSGQKLGYLALARFANVHGLEEDLENIFQTFAVQSVETLVVDLRYNTGGYVKVVETLGNLMAPSTLNGKTMYAEHFNQTMQQGKATILKNQPYYGADGKPVTIQGRPATYHDVDYSTTRNTRTFQKAGNFQSLKKVYFIVSGNTASASEMLIQIFRPYVDVKIVGMTTYGKPVGFFGVNVDKYTVYFSSFHIRNGDGEGDYYDGIIPDIPATDDIGYDFGDVREASLSVVLSDISGTSASLRSKALPKAVQTEETGYRVSGFKGVVEDRVQWRKE